MVCYLDGFFLLFLVFRESVIFSCVDKYSVLSCLFFAHGIVFNLILLVFVFLCWGIGLVVLLWYLEFVSLLLFLVFCFFCVVWFFIVCSCVCFEFGVCF